MNTTEVKLERRTEKKILFSQKLKEGYTKYLNRFLYIIKFPFVYIIVLTEVDYQSAVQSPLKFDDWLIEERKTKNSIPINKYLMNYSLN